MTTDRDLLITLGASFELPRPAVCRLGLHAERLRNPPTGSPARVALAAEIGVPAEVLETACRLLHHAGATARREEESARRRGARIVTAADPEYPPSLHDLDLPPPSLYVRGPRSADPTDPADPADPADRAPFDASRAVAIVGSRRADAYGRESAELFGRELAAAGLTVVSGFARGVDAAAHRGALAARPDGSTVAVLGSGLGVDYPRGHRRLGDEIAGCGALVTEFPCGVEPKAWHFPVRNRLIAALSAATLVVRAAPRSGSLITARFALDLGRDVLALPGRIFEERSQGTNALLADGAYPALHPRDVLDLLGVPSGPSAGSGDDADAAGAARSSTPAKGLEGRLLEVMTPAEPEPPEALAERLEVPVDRVLGALLALELAGRVRRQPGPAYVRRP